MAWLGEQDIVPVGGNNIELSLLASAARTATVEGDDQRNRGAGGVMVVLDVTAVTATPSIVLKIQGKDPASGKYIDLLTAAAVAIVGTTVYVLHMKCGAAAGSITKVVNHPLPQTWRITVTHADTDSITYSVGSMYIP